MKCKVRESVWGALFFSLSLSSLAPRESISHADEDLVAAYAKERKISFCREPYRIILYENTSPSNWCEKIIFNKSALLIKTKQNFRFFGDLISLCARNIAGLIKEKKTDSFWLTRHMSALCKSARDAKKEKKSEIYSLRGGQVVTGDLAIQRSALLCAYICALGALSYWIYSLSHEKEASKAFWTDKFWKIKIYWPFRMHTHTQ